MRISVMNTMVVLVLRYLYKKTVVCRHIRGGEFLAFWPLKTPLKINPRPARPISITRTARGGGTPPLTPDPCSTPLDTGTH